MLFNRASYADYTLGNSFLDPQKIRPSLEEKFSASEVEERYMTTR